MRIALTGGTGFVGGAVALSLRESGHHVRSLIRARPGGLGHAPADPDPASVVLGGLEDPAALDDLLAGADVLIHAASYVGPDPGAQQQVNVDGTRRLMAAAKTAGVRRVLYVSTSGVYGAQLRNGAREDALTPAPRSSLSASRLAAEHLVLDAGGVVVRPHMVTGAGDRWFLLPYLALTVQLGAWINGGTTRVSVIDRRTLADAVVGLALHSQRRGVFHAAYPEPVGLRDLALPVLDAAGIASPAAALSSEQAMDYAARHAIPASQMAIAAHDNYLDSCRLWSALGRTPDPQPHLVPGDVSWYASHLAAVAAET